MQELLLESDSVPVMCDNSVEFEIYKLNHRNTVCNCVCFSLDGLVMRFEAPQPKNRWDSPLFTILPEDELPCEAICDALFHRKAPPPNMSTVSVGIKFLTSLSFFVKPFVTHCFTEKHPHKICQQSR